MGSDSEEIDSMFRENDLMFSRATIERTDERFSIDRALNYWIELMIIPTLTHNPPVIRLFCSLTTPAADRHTRTTTHTTSLLPPPTFISKNVVARVRPITNSVRPGQDVKLQPRVSWAGRKTAAAQCPLHGEDA